MKKYLWTILFFIMPVIGIVSCQSGCSTMEKTLGSETVSLVKDASLQVALIGLDSAIADVNELQGMSASLERDVVDAFSTSGDPKEIGKNLTRNLARTVVNESLRSLVQRGIREALTGEGSGQTGAINDPAAVAFNTALAAEL